MRCKSHFHAPNIAREASQCGPSILAFDFSYAPPEQGAQSGFHFEEVRALGVGSLLLRARLFLNVTFLMGVARIFFRWCNRLCGSNLPPTTKKVIVFESVFLGGAICARKIQNKPKTENFRFSGLLPFPECPFQNKKVHRWDPYKICVAWRQTWPFLIIWKRAKLGLMNGPCQAYWLAHATSERVHASSQGHIQTWGSFKRLKGPM